MKPFTILLLFCSPFAYSQISIYGGVNYSPHKIIGTGYNANLNQFGIEAGILNRSRLFKGENLGLVYGVGANLWIKNMANNSKPNSIPPFPANSGYRYVYFDDYFWGLLEFPISLSYRIGAFEIAGGVLLSGSRRSLGDNERNPLVPHDSIAGFGSYLLTLSNQFRDRIRIKASFFKAFDSIWSSSNSGGYYSELLRNGVSLDFVYHLQ